MQAIDNQLGTKLNMDYLYESLRRAYQKFNAAKPGDTKMLEAILVEIETMERYMKSLSISFMKKVLSDANFVGQDREKLLEIERMLNNIAKAEHLAIRQDHYLHKFAKNLRGVVHSKVRKTKASGIREFKKVQKEKKDLSSKEKEAKEKMGRKAA